MDKKLTSVTEIIVRFSECDALKMVWHGNYVKYFEDGREDFGKQYNLGYMDIFNDTGLAVPLIHLECDYKKMVGIGEKIKVETTLINDPAAKIIFEYRVLNQQNEVVCTGKTIQVFIDVKKKELMITVPPYIANWKRKYFA